jgi:glycosyltransferase involved in cell wall biosynthesis
VGGAEVLAARLARRLRPRCRFLFVCLDELGALGEELCAEGFPVEVLRRRPGLDWRCAVRLGRLLRRERVSLIHAHQYTPFFYGLLARLFHRCSPVLFTEHGRHQPDHPRWKRRLANRLLLERRDRVVGVGAAVRQALIDNEGIPGNRVEVVYNGIDPDRCAARLGEREAARRELGLGGDDLAVLQVARLDYLKDHATAVRTIGRVAGRCPSVCLLLAGEGPEREAIRAQVERLGLTNQVRFLGLRQDVPRLLAAADLFLLTSISEGIPLTLIEAMAAGLPVVSTRVGGTGEVVIDGETGLLTPPRDDAALAEAVLRLAQMPGLRRRMGQCGAERARSLFSEERMADQYFELYEEMLHGRSGISAAGLLAGVRG